jgi:hypothetical protein
MENNLLKMLFIRASWFISIKVGASHPWVKRIQVCTNEERGPLKKWR